MEINSIMNIIIKTISQIVTFALEITMLISYGYYGLTRPWTFIPRLFFTILLIGIAIAFWAIFAAPKSGHRIEMPYLVFFRTFMFFVPAVLLFQMGHKYWAVWLIGLTVITQTISYFTEK